MPTPTNQSNNIVGWVKHSATQQKAFYIYILCICQIFLFCQTDKWGVSTFSIQPQFCRHIYRIDMTAKFSSFAKRINMELPIFPPDR
ncbi:hypothetical protein, partial [Dapis sp. BLCC M229]|uniref:hypothetical protein n=1 Tax=Dapis sp. BLCC M229 TaxID=3400188 RepID=UPI003CF15078